MAFRMSLPSSMKRRETKLMLLGIIIFLAVIFVYFNQQALMQILKSRFKPNLQEGYADNIIPVVWKDLGALASKVAVGGDGAKYAISFDFGLSTYDESKNSWKRIPANFTDIAAKSASEIIGLTRMSMIYQSQDANNASPNWLRLSNSRFLDTTYAVDGTIWAVTHGISSGGVNSSSNLGIFNYDVSSRTWNRMPGSLKQVAAKSAMEGWGVASDDSVWKWSAGVWSQVSNDTKDNSQFSLKQISVGSDGDVWGVNRQGELWHRTRAGNWEKAVGTFKYVDVKDSSELLAIDENNKVLKGTPTTMTDVTDPVESLFTISCYSGGSAAFSYEQHAAIGWAYLQINGVTVLDNSDDAISRPANGLNVVALAETGHPILIKSFDTGSQPGANQLFSQLHKILAYSTV